MVGNRGKAPCLGVGLMKRVSRRMLVAKTPEYNTSKTCCRCHGACGAHTTVDFRQCKSRETRGLRLCENRSCRRPLNRDANAAVNIGYNLMALLCGMPLIAEMNEAEAEMAQLESAVPTDE